MIMMILACRPNIILSIEALNFIDMKLIIRILLSYTTNGSRLRSINRVHLLLPMIPLNVNADELSRI